VLSQRYRATTVGAAVLGATGAALAVTGVVLLATGGRRPSVAVAPWGARGVGGPPPSRTPSETRRAAT